MTYNELYITRLSAWTPGIESSAQWDEWARNERQMNYACCDTAKDPDISFTEPMFRRRLSQLSKMTVRIIHDLLPFEDNTKILFLSFRGELSRQYQINKMLIEEKALMPAAFSLSVFNAPAALASIAFNLKGGYSAVYPGKNSFTAGLLAAKAALLSSEAQELAFVYADEQAPTEYTCFFDENTCAAGKYPFTFALLLNKQNCSGSIPLSSLCENDNVCDTGPHTQMSPEYFLRKLLLCGDLHVSP